MERLNNMQSLNNNKMQSLEAAARSKHCNALLQLEA